MTQVIPELSTKSSEGIIPRSVAEPTYREDPEIQPFLISYYYYNDKECGIRDLEKNVSKKTLENLRTIGKLSSPSDFKTNNIDDIPVRQNGEYLKLYNRLPEGSDLKEHKIQGTSRLFYFVTLEKIRRIFHIVAITGRHYETDKVRK